MVSETSGDASVATPPPAARIRGVPMPLPPGERVLWQGAPSARALARFTFHQRKLAAYFYLMLAWWAFNAIGTLSPRDFAVRGLVLLALSTVPVLFAEVLARLVARSTVYAITDRRIVMKLGVVFPLTINLPLRMLASAGLKQNADGTGQLALPLVETERLAYVALWPHCRPFEFTRPVPVFRAVEQPTEVGNILRSAVVELDGGAVSDRVVEPRAAGRAPEPVPV